MVTTMRTLNAQRLLPAMLTGHNQWIDEIVLVAVLAKPGLIGCDNFQALNALNGNRLLNPFPYPARH